MARGLQRRRDKATDLARNFGVVAVPMTAMGDVEFAERVIRGRVEPGSVDLFGEWVEFHGRWIKMDEMRRKAAGEGG